jgi:hypothetical protein
LDKKTKQVLDGALQLPYADRSALLKRLLWVLGEGPEMGVFDAVLTLPEAGRWQVIDALFDAVDEAEEERVDREWTEEIRRRIQEAESGAPGIPWSEAQRMARERARADS